MRALCHETRLKQIGCVHTSDTCEELCMYIHALSFILSRTFFSSSSSSFFISLPVWFRSSLFRARAKKKDERNIVLIPVNTHRSKEEKKERTTYSVPVFSLFSANTGKDLLLGYSTLFFSSNMVHQYIDFLFLFSLCSDRDDVKR